MLVLGVCVRGCAGSPVLFWDVRRSCADKSEVMMTKLFHRRARCAPASFCTSDVGAATTVAAARLLAAGLVGITSGGAGPATKPASSTTTRHRSHLEPLEGRRLMAVDVTVNTMQRYQPIDGFGTAMASYVGGLYNSAWSDMYYQDLGASM